MIPLATRDELAADLAQAERSRQPIAPLTEAHPGIDVVDAYEIQLINIRRRSPRAPGCAVTRSASPPRPCSR